MISKIEFLRSISYTLNWGQNEMVICSYMESAGNIVINYRGLLSHTGHNLLNLFNKQGIRF